MVGDGPMQGHRWRARRGPEAGGGSEGRSGVRMGTEWEGRRFLCSLEEQGPEADPTLCSTCGRPDEDADTLEKHGAENRAPVPISQGRTAPAPSFQESGEKALESLETRPLILSLSAAR